MEKAMLHTDGDWEELPLTECLALVSRGKAREATGESVSHYDDNLRTFLTIEEEGDDCTDCDAIVTADDLKSYNRKMEGTGEEFSRIQIDFLADCLKAQNPAFNRERWLGYIAGTCGKNGGAVK